MTQEMIAEKLDQLNKEVTRINEEKERTGERDGNAYLVKGLVDLTQMLLDCDQSRTLDTPDSNPVLTDKVLRVYKYVSQYDIDHNNLKTAFVDGLFIEAKVYLLPKNRCEKAMKNRYNSVLHPEEFGLPSRLLVDYATIKPLDSSSYIAIARTDECSVINDLIRRVSNYDYVYLA